MILAGRSQRRNPCEVRSSLSQFPPGRTSLQPTGRKTATRSSYADVRFVNTIRSSVMAVAASRLTTSITTGIWIHRGRCADCGTTFTFLPLLSLPYTHFSLLARCRALLRRFAEHCSWEKALPTLKDPDRTATELRQRARQSLAAAVRTLAVRKQTLSFVRCIPFYKVNRSYWAYQAA